MRDWRLISIAFLISGAAVLGLCHAPSHADTFPLADTLPVVRTETHESQRVEKEMNKALTKEMQRAQLQAVCREAGRGAAPHILIPFGNGYAFVYPFAGCARLPQHHQEGE